MTTKALNWSAPVYIMAADFKYISNSKRLLILLFLFALYCFKRKKIKHEIMNV